uniref:Podoplanin n=1 Tax=Saimiri boliviensis boliviensis TaxID=39432 RepID=A0A2K6TVH0_SAIBB
MLTPLGKFSTAKFAVRLPGAWEARAPSCAGAAAPTLRPPPSRSSGLGLWPRNSLLGPRESNSSGTMWKVSALLLVLGSASLWVLAEGGKTQHEWLPAVAGNYLQEGMPCGEKMGTKEDKWMKHLTTTNQRSVNKTKRLETLTQNIFIKNLGLAGRDGLATVTLVGIIVGVLLAIGFIGGIIVVVMRKMSGRYS